MSMIISLVMTCLLAWAGILGPLDEYRWKNRIILLSADTPENAAYLKQKQLIDEGGHGFDDRDLVSFHLFSNHGLGPDDQPLPFETLKFLRQQYELGAHPFTLVLIGKDGTVKRTSHAPVPEQSLYDQIDSMPMRKIEMQRGR